MLQYSQHVWQPLFIVCWQTVGFASHGSCNMCSHQLLILSCRVSGLGHQPADMLCCCESMVTMMRVVHTCVSCRAAVAFRCGHVQRTGRSRLSPAPGHHQPQAAKTSASTCWNDLSLDEAYCSSNGNFLGFEQPAGLPVPTRDLTTRPLVPCACS